MIGSAYTALKKIGARKSLNVGYRGSFALIGYTGPGRPAFVTQVTLSDHPCLFVALTSPLSM